MQTFIELAADACFGANVSAMLLLSADGLDIALALASQGILDITARVCRRQLRIVGAVGLHDMQPAFVFKEPLPVTAVAAFGLAFAEYVRSLDPDYVAQQELAALERLWSIPDTRPINFC